MGILRHPPVLLGVLDAVGDDIRWQVLNELCRRVGIMATTYAVFAMDRDEVRSLAAELYRSIVSERSYSDEEEPGDAEGPEASG